MSDRHCTLDTAAPGTPDPPGSGSAAGAVSVRQRRPRRVTLALDTDPLGPLRTRHAIRALMHGAGEGVMADAMLLACELVTNALMHGSGTCVLTAVFEPGRGGTARDVVRIEVGDLSTTLPAMAPADRDPRIAGGHGLRMVDRLSRRWGVTPSPIGKIVWFELDV